MNDPAKDRFERLVESLPCYVTVQDRNLNVLWMNDACRRDFGSSLPRTCYELYTADKTKCPDCPVEETFADGEVHSKEMALTTDSGHRVNVIVHSSPLRDNNGAITSVVETAVNIASVKEMQKQLILLGQTVAGMAHSIKNIMMGLEGGIYIINKGIEAKNQNEIKDGWEMVLFNFDKIAHIVKDILYCSKEREPNLKTVKPNEIVREVHTLFKDLAQRYAIEIRLDLDDDVQDAVIDPEGLHTVLTNLVTNAMDACKLDLWKDEHLVELRTRRRKDGAIIIEVADNGIGIDKKVGEHVFEDFFTSKGDKGTGLGLMVTQKILREHGGNITFRSRPGQGTTFVATFPFKDLPQS